MSMISKFAITGALFAGLLALGGCDPQECISNCTAGGGGGGGGGPALTTLTSTAAIGDELAGATVEVRGSGSAPLVNTTTDTNGDYTIDVSTLTAPLVIVVTGGTYDPDGSGPAGTTTNSVALYSVSLSGIGVANVTPLTSLALQNAINSSDLLALFNNWGTTRPTATEIATGAARVRANLAAQFTAAGVSSSYNFFSATFPTVGSGIDAVLDTVSCTSTGGAGALAVSCQNTTTSTPIPYNTTIAFAAFQSTTMTVELFFNGVSADVSPFELPFLPPTLQSEFCTIFIKPSDYATLGFTLNDCTYNPATNSGATSGMFHTPTGLDIPFSQIITFS